MDLMYYRTPEIVRAVEGAAALTPADRQMIYRQLLDRLEELGPTVPPYYSGQGLVKAGELLKQKLAVHGP